MEVVFHLIKPGHRRIATIAGLETTWGGKLRKQGYIDALLFAVDAGLSLPDDLAIVGFDDIPEATIVRPKLTTIHKDRNQLAATAVQMLLERINSEEALPARQRMLGYEIVYRDSA